MYNQPKEKTSSKHKYLNHKIILFECVQKQTRALQVKL